jgi:hypothetical protein
VLRRKPSGRRFGGGAIRRCYRQVKGCGWRRWMLLMLLVLLSMLPHGRGHAVIKRRRGSCRDVAIVVVAHHGCTGIERTDVGILRKGRRTGGWRRIGKERDAGVVLSLGVHAQFTAAGHYFCVGCAAAVSAVT